MIARRPALSSNLIRFEVWNGFTTGRVLLLSLYPDSPRNWFTQLGDAYRTCRNIRTWHCLSSIDFHSSLPSRSWKLLIVVTTWLPRRSCSAIMRHITLAVLISTSVITAFAQYVICDSVDGDAPTMVHFTRDDRDYRPLQASLTNSYFMWWVTVTLVS